MPKRMLIDAAHPEETRVVVTSGQRLEEFDFESSTKRQVKGNIYLAKVTRVEPSLQAAFVDYGGNRHGFLAFSEIHPDYYRIPVSDRGTQQSEPAFDIDAPAEAPADEAGVALAAALPEPVAVPEPAATDDDEDDEPAASDGQASAERWRAAETAPPPPAESVEAAVDQRSEPTDAPPPAPPAAAGVGWIYAPGMEPRTSEPEMAPPPAATVVAGGHAEIAADVNGGAAEAGANAAAELVDDGVDNGVDGGEEPAAAVDGPPAMALRTAEESLLAIEVGEPIEMGDGDSEAESVETLGGDEVEEVEEADAERRRWHSSRHYKIQEVIKRRQIMLVQVAKEERGNKGAALTTYLSLAGRYCVLMPNTNRGGGVSRKINSLSDRRRLKEILEELDIPEGMGVIVRTAGAERSKAEIKRDYEYLLRLWNEIRDLTLKSTAPALIYEEGNLIKRSIRDLYTRDIDEVLVEGEEGYKTAKAFMRTLMPSHAKRVQPYRDPQVPLFQRFQIESQIDAIHSPVAQLRSGAYIVINQTEALVAIDVNSGRSTRERNIEETALRTNLEAADEIARQLRLRDLAGLIVIDFIDMEEHRNQAAVERRMKEALKNDRARIQVGRISPFGLLEMSRQRLRPSLAETSTQPCPHCGGTGFIRSVESTALYVLRSIEEEGIRRRSAEICVYVPTNVALYILNQKRESLNQIEARYAIKVVVARDDSLIPPSFRLERLRAYEAGEAPPLRAIQAPIVPEDEEDEEALDEAVLDIAERPEAVEAAGAEPDSEEERGRRRRRRRRRRSDEGREARPASVREEAAADGEGETGAAEAAAEGTSQEDEREREAEAERRRRRRGRRGGRTRPRREEAAETGAEPSTEIGADTPPVAAAETVEVIPQAAQPATEEEADIAAEPAPWATDAGVETAALAPFAGESYAPPQPLRGDGAAEATPAATAPTAEPEPAPTGEREDGIPFESPFERELETTETAPSAPEAIAEASPPAFAAAAGMANGPELREPDPQPEMASEPEAAPPAAPPSRRDENVLTVTEKPANPRRGWWQRLMQS